MVTPLTTNIAIGNTSSNAGFSIAMLVFWGSKTLNFVPKDFDHDHVCRQHVVSTITKSMQSISKNFVGFPMMFELSTKAGQDL